ncbi:hypothetical protein GGQ71_000748 [Rhizobium taibaishanense]|uniref:Uncharacterized protein n=1 Tax=Allorhizobium taibaishanense TaxID=887144 RepID=A0A7W6MSU9_9HYPH|nr:hypothetical protein [Allorhizobium taibaishanense]
MNSAIQPKGVRPDGSVRVLIRLIAAIGPRRWSMLSH